MWRFGAYAVLFVIVVSSAGCGRTDNPPPPPVVKSDPLPEDVDPEPRLAFRFDPGMRFGLTVLKDAAGAPVGKKLTYHEAGSSNDTLVRIDNQDIEFGAPSGKWLHKEIRTERGARSIWSARGIEITQSLEIVPSKQPVDIAPNVRKRILDTCLIRYEIENKDSKEHKVGMRIMVDTLIGSNDGVPFAVPTMQGLVTTFQDFPTANSVPDFVQALEIPNLQNPGTVGHMTLKVGGGVEPPVRVSLTAWQPVMSKQNTRLLHWNVPVQHMGADSAVVMYWNDDKVLKPTEKRTIGFAYGVGSVSAGEATGQLGLTLNGAFFPGGAFTVTAYVNKPAKGQTLTLDLPPGLKRVEGKATEIVPPPLAGLAEGRDTSIMTWKVESSERGKYQLKVRSSTGVSQTKEVTIQGE